MNDYKSQLFADKPSDWRIEKLGNLFKEREEKGYPDLPLLAVTGGSGITPRDQLNRRDTSSEDKSKYRLLKVGDIAYNTMRLWQGVLGLSQHEGIVSPAYTVLKPQDGVHAPFFYYLMKTPWMINSFLRYSSGLCSDTNNCKYESFKLIRTLVPSLPEQQKIAEILGSVDENIEKAQALIAKLQDLKKATMQKLLTKGIRHTKFKDSPVGKIPEEWEVRTVSDLFDMQLGKMLSKAAKTGTCAFPYLGNRSVQWDYVDISDLESMDFNDRERQKFSLIPGDLLVCEGGEVGRTALWRGERTNCYYQKAIHRLRPNNPSIKPAYMLRYMRWAANNGIVAEFSTRTSIYHLTGEMFAQMPVKVPPIKEQDQIVAVFDAIDGSILSRQSFLQKAQSLKNALMQDLLTGRVRVKV